MHELSLTEDLLRIIEERAVSEGFQSVSKVLLEVGELSHVEPEAMQFCFASVMKGSCAEHAKLEIVRITGKGLCTQCKNITELHQYYDPCQHCGAFGVQAHDGQHIRIQALEAL